MADLTTNFAGLTLKSPVIIGSSSITGNVNHYKDFEDNGAGAIVLKSLFEEEIVFEYHKVLEEAQKFGYDDNEYLDYFDYKIKEDNLNRYLELINEGKKKVNIPIIASINCISDHEWVYFVKKFEEAGADAVELNVFILPSDLRKTSAEIEQTYFNILDAVKKETKLPVIIKMSYFFSNLGRMIIEVSKKADGVVLFNRFYSPDIDINKREIVPASIFSRKEDVLIPLRWLAISYGKVEADLAASTGVHDGEALIKVLLAGANAAEVVSTIYKNGIGQIGTMIKELEKYMDNNGIASVKDMIGTVSQKNIKNPGLYERVQFMRYFSDHEDIV